MILQICLLLFVLLLTNPTITIAQLPNCNAAIGQTGVIGCYCSGPTYTVCTSNGAWRLGQNGDNRGVWDGGSQTYCAVNVVTG
jgi:hypothetical protein